MRPALVVMVVGLSACWFSGCTEATAGDEEPTNDRPAIPPPEKPPELFVNNPPAGSAPPGGQRPPSLPADPELPILPPRFAAGFDFWAGDARPLATEEAVRAAFRMLAPGASGGGATTFSWEGKLDVSFAKDTKRVRTVSFYRGYPGLLSFKSPATSSFGEHAFIIRLGKEIERDGFFLHADWNDHDQRSELAQVCRALLFTFAPASAPADDAPLGSDDCEWWMIDDARMGGFRVPKLSLNLVADLATETTPATTIASVHMHFFASP